MIELLHQCPFCKEEEFDLPGLKAHLEQGDCKVYEETVDLPNRVFT